MKALVEHHEANTKSLIKQFKDEIGALKQTHKTHIDNLMDNFNDKLKDYETEIKLLKEKHTKELQEKDLWCRNQIQVSKEQLQKDLESHFSNQIQQLKQETHNEKLKMHQERDSQLKEIISKVYDEIRSQLKQRELELKTQIRNLKSQKNLQEASVQTLDHQEESQDLNTFSDQITQTLTYQTNQLIQVEQSTKNTECQTIEDLDKTINQIHQDYNYKFEEVEKKVKLVVENKNKHLEQVQLQLEKSQSRVKELEEILKNLSL